MNLIQLPSILIFWILLLNPAAGFFISQSRFHPRVCQFKLLDSRKPNQHVNHASILRKDIKKRKAARILRDELISIIKTEDFQKYTMPDEEALQTVSISSIEMNNDLSLAKIYLSVAGNSVERRKVYVWLCKHVSAIRHSLHQRLRTMKRIPFISFALSDSSTKAYFDHVFSEISTESTQDFNVAEMIDFDEIDDE
jgi:ribosome-binding factor A